ncbi:glycoside hydrolase family 16 protein [Pseudonocardia oroxyli]|uniref:glycoside hydrolase family 16 protein n=1 Tax=Pseudonocardia oroxyli TaxID=366584 RepID=UPI0015A16384|nr:glycoside hydrolase family 16 protein [Pseudonocardia oroxyli]
MLSSFALLACVVGVSAASVPAPQRVAVSGTPGNGCGNPVLATDAAGWSTVPGDDGSRVATTAHIVAGHELVVHPAEARTLVHAPDRAVPGAGSWDLTVDLRSTADSAARLEATWFDADDTALGRARGQWVTVRGGERYTRVGDRFLAPEHAVRAEIAVAVDQAGPAPFAVTMCSYRPVEPAPVPVVVGTVDHPAPPVTTPPTTAAPTTTAPTTTPPVPTTSPVAPTTTPATPTPSPTPPVTTTPVTTTPVTTPPVTTPPTTTPPTTTPPVTTPPTTTPPTHGPDDPGVRPVPLTAAERYGWGTPLPASDEFDRPGAPDPAKWVQAGECWPGHTGNGRRCASRTTVENGVLVETGLANGDTGWLASTHGTQYGRWEMRVRSLQTGSGASPYHPVLIVWPDSENWPADGEYDFLENSSPGAACAEAWLHYPHPTLPVQQEFARETDCGAPLSEWHTIAFEWTPEHVRGFLDGEQWFSFSGGAGPGGRAPIQAMPSGHLTIQLDNYDDAGRGNAPARLEVDWVRMYAV